MNSVYDMYTRFVRWASDRIGDEGIIAFVIGRKPIAKAAYDGFRKVAEREFSDIWLLDLGGDVRDNPKLSGTTHNVFGIQTGVMVALLVKRKGKSGAVIRYARRPEMETAADKLAWVGAARSFEGLPVETIVPDKRHDWIDQAVGIWDKFLSLADPKADSSDATPAVRAIFRLSSNGVTTQRDEWAFDFDRSTLTSKMHFLIDTYEAVRTEKRPVDRDIIKWDRELEILLKRNVALGYEFNKETRAAYRAFTKSWLYFDRKTVAMTYRMPTFFPVGKSNVAFAFDGIATSSDFSMLAIDGPFDKGLMKTGNGRARGVARYRYLKSGERVDNITDWALNKFVARYGKKGVSKDTIFTYVYAVLHDPVYRETYALNLKREFPRIPFYPDFARWSAWGQALMDMHIGYEDVAPWPVERVETPNPKRAEGTSPKPILKSLPDQGIVRIDEDTQITGIPLEAWDYRLGNRSAIDWVLDQHKEKTPRDPTIREKFNTYRFADYKESMIALLAKVVRVSVDTVAITQAMRGLDRTGWEVEG